MSETAHAERRSGFSCTQHADMAEKIKDIHAALLGDFKEEGVVSKVKRHEGFVKGWNRFTWIFITAVVVSLVAGVYSLATTVALESKQCQTSNIGK